MPAWRWKELIIKTRLFQMSYRLFIIGGSLDVLNIKKERRNNRPKRRKRKKADSKAFQKRKRENKEIK